MIDEDDLVARIAERVGGEDREAARRALDATLAALVGALDPVEAEALASDLPSRLAMVVRRAERGAPPWRSDAFDEVAERASLPRGRAAEYASIACRALAERLGDEIVRLLDRKLPEPWRTLVQPRELAPPPPPVQHPVVPGAGHTLASGRPGSQHAVADHGVDPASGRRPR